MKAREFLSKLRHEGVVSAIAEAERHTSGEIRVYVSRFHRPDPLAAARARFARLRMHETTERNAVLIYVSPEAQTFGIIGDEAVHARCSQGFWEEVCDAMATEFKAGRINEGIIRAVHLAGAELRRHFPRHPGDKDQLPNDIVTD